MKIKLKRQTALPADSDGGNQIAILRLRESKADLTAKPLLIGRRAGAEYVLNHATWVEMKNLEGVRIQIAAAGNIKLLAFSMRIDGSHSDFIEMMRSKYGDWTEYNGWVKGFVESAMEKFHELEKAL